MIEFLGCEIVKIKEEETKQDFGSGEIINLKHFPAEIQELENGYYRISDKEFYVNKVYGEEQALLFPWDQSETVLEEWHYSQLKKNVERN